MAMTISPIKLTAKEWLHNIRPKLIEQYGPSIAISYVQRRELGFVCRRSSWLDENNQYYEHYFLDFWEEKYKTMFILRWL
jgi:hypothetical protein